MASFTLSAKPDTDIWKKPPTHDVFNAPSRSISSSKVSLFSSATLTFTATYTHQFDQAGILLTLTHPSSPRKWIKAGVEFFDSTPRLSTVCCDRYADWSVALPQHGQDIQHGKRSVTILVEKKIAEDGKCLWVYALEDGKRTPLREITWVFGEEGWVLDVSAAVARPGKDIDGEFEARFEGFRVTWNEK